MVEPRDVFEYLPAQGINRHGLEINIRGVLYRGDESSLISAGRISQEEKPLRVDPEPPPFIGTYRQV